MKVFSNVPIFVWLIIGVALILISLIVGNIFPSPNLEIITSLGKNVKFTQPSVLSTVTFLSGVITLTKLLIEFLKSKPSPVLEYDGLEKYDFFRKYPQPDQPLGEYFYLKIKKSNGKDIAKSVPGFLTIQGTEIIMLPLQWHLDKSSERHIQDYHYLFLFSVNIYRKDDVILNSSYILFPHSSNLVSKHFGGNWKVYRDKTIEVRIQCENGRTPKDPYKETIIKVVENAPKMNN